MVNIWRARTQAGASLPNITLGTVGVPGTQLLDGAERWAGAFRSAGLGPGSRLVTALPTGACLAEVLLAGLWEGLTLVPMPPAIDPAQAGAEADPTAAVAAPGAFGGRDVSWAWRAEGSDGPGLPPRALRPAGPPTPLARLLCAPSEAGPWAALFDDNLEHAVDTVLASLQPTQARWLSVLPWHTPAGLLLDLLPALLSAASIVRPSIEEEPSPSDVANTVQRWQPTHAVLPLGLVRDLLGHWDGLGPLACLVGGLASGPGLDGALAAELSKTRLRTHRGAPELSCMVTLGEPGIWRPGALGRPVGCTISDGPGGGLLISGRALAGGQWADGILALVDRRAPRVVAFV